MSRQAHSGPEASVLADQYGPPMLRYPSRSVGQSEMSHVLTLPEPHHAHMHHSMSYAIPSPQTSPFSMAPASHSHGTSPDRPYSSLQFPEYQQLVTIQVEETSDATVRKIEPELHPLVDKNIFFNGTATCYRRNYISVQVSYSLPDCAPGAKLYCSETSQGGPRRIQAFAVTLSATIDKPQGKSVQLIQHTPKRDKGPKIDPPMVLLPPSPVGGAALNAYPMASNFSGPELPLQNVELQRSPFSTSQHTFERIQFQQATANNGRRRAQQQFYYLCAELHADCRLPGEQQPFWVKVTRRTSEAMVVRGRSPGHYKDGSSDVSGPGQGPGQGPGPASGGGGSYAFEGYLPHRPGSTSNGLGDSYPRNHSGTMYHNQHHAHHFEGQVSPAYTNQPSPAQSHGPTPGASPYSGAMRYSDDGHGLKSVQDDYRIFHGEPRHMQPPSPIHDAYGGVRHAKSEQSLSQQLHGPPTPNSLKNESVGWHSTNCRRYTPMNAGFALDAGVGY